MELKLNKLSVLHSLFCLCLCAQVSSLSLYTELLTLVYVLYVNALVDVMCVEHVVAHVMDQRIFVVSQ